MKTSLSEKFKSLLKTPYLFHLHTNYTDGKSTVEEYCSWAEKHGYTTLFFTEHVRKKLNYDFSLFLADIEKARNKFKKLTIWTGIEVKILPSGELDIPKDLSGIEVICFACHSFPKDARVLEEALKRAFSDEKCKQFVRVWTHPSSIYGYVEEKDRTGILQTMITFAKYRGIFIEYNRVYDTLFSKSYIVGQNAHSVDELE